MSVIMCEHSKIYIWCLRKQVVNYINCHKPFHCFKVSFRHNAVNVFISNKQDSLSLTL